MSERDNGTSPPPSPQVMGSELSALTEWKQSVINVCRGCGSDELPWGGDKTGWGFIYYFIQHLHTRALSAETTIETLRAALKPFSDLYEEIPEDNFWPSEEYKNLGIANKAFRAAIAVTSEGSTDANS